MGIGTQKNVAINPDLHQRMKVEVASVKGGTILEFTELAIELALARTYRRLKKAKS